MHRVLLAIGLSAGLLFVAGCADDGYGRYYERGSGPYGPGPYGSGPYGPGPAAYYGYDRYSDGGPGEYGPTPVGYDGYYDDYYGPFYDGCWAGDGGFYYSDGPGHGYRRGDPRHFRREA